jgi:hypothetical protein
MDQRVDRAGTMTPAVTGATTVRIVSRRELAGLPHWQSAFARQRKDHRYYELVEDTLPDGFAYGYLGVENGGAIIAIQPFFTIDQDLMAGAGRAATALVAAARRIWPRSSGNWRFSATSRTTRTSSSATPPIGRTATGWCSTSASASRATPTSCS